MSLFVFGTVDTEFPETIKDYLTKVWDSGTEILVVSGTSVCKAVYRFLPNSVKICPTLIMAMESCDSAIALWDIKVSETGRIIDTLDSMHKYVRIYDVVRNQWC